MSQTLAAARALGAPRSQCSARPALSAPSARPVPRPQLRAVLSGAGGSGCCGGSHAAQPADSSSRDKASGAGCGCSGSAASAGQGAAQAVMQQLNGMMGGMEGSLTREDMQAALEAAAPRHEGGERFLDLGSLLRSSGVGGDEDDEAELDALVV